MRLSHQDDPLPDWAIDRSILKSCLDQSHSGGDVSSGSYKLLYIVLTIP